MPPRPTSSCTRPSSFNEGVSAAPDRHGRSRGHRCRYRHGRTAWGHPRSREAQAPLVPVVVDPRPRAAAVDRAVERAVEQQPQRAGAMRHRLERVLRLAPDHMRGRQIGRPQPAMAQKCVPRAGSRADQRDDNAAPPIRRRRLGRSGPNGSDRSEQAERAARTRRTIRIAPLRSLSTAPPGRQSGCSLKGLAAKNNVICLMRAISFAMQFAFIVFAPFVGSNAAQDSGCPATFARAELGRNASGIQHHIAIASALIC